MTVRRDETAGGRWIDRRTAAAIVTSSISRPPSA